MIIRDFRYIIYELDQKENIFKSKTFFFFFFILVLQASMGTNI